MRTPVTRLGRKPSPLKRTQDDQRFLYIKLADTIRNQIKSGSLKPGERLPSMDTLAATYRINKITVKRAVAQLYAAGLIYSVPSQGTYVAERRPLTTFALQRRPLAVGLVSSDRETPESMYMEIIQGLRDELSHFQGNLVMLPIRESEPEVRVLNRLVRAQLDTVIYLGMSDSPVLRRLLAEGPPAILLDCDVPNHQSNAVVTDHRGGAAQVMDHLLGLGHRRIVVLGGSGASSGQRGRLAGVRDALERREISVETVRVLACEGGLDAARARMTEIIKAREIPTAVCCFSDEMAVGVIQALNDVASLNVPRDVSVTGFDDTVWATASQPSLTTVHLDRNYMGRLTIQRVWSMFKDKDPATITVLPARLVVRSSTAPCGKKGAHKSVARS